MSTDFERELTKRVWTDEAFADLVERDPAAALGSMGIGVPQGVKLKIVVQRTDRLYFTIPPVRERSSAAPTALNQMDLWSSKGIFIWLVPVAAKFKLLALRQAARAQGTRT